MYKHKVARKSIVVCSVRCIVRLVKMSGESRESKCLGKNGGGSFFFF